MRLSIVIIALNEEAMIGRALASAAFADEVLVVDGGSTDSTVAIARHAGARVVERPFDDFARQRNFALEQSTGDWVFFLDADERIPRDLAAEVRAAITMPSRDCYRVPRLSMALGRWLRWHPGGPDTPARLVRRDSGARWSGTVHEAIEGAGEPGTLIGHLVHLTHRSISDVVRKIDAYTSFEAAERAARGDIAPAGRELLKAYPRALKRLWRAGLRREGMEGAVEAFLLAFNETLVAAKLWERSRAGAIEEAYRRADAGIEVATPAKRATGDRTG